MRTITSKTLFCTLTVIFIVIFSSKLFAAGMLTPNDGSTPPLSMKEHHVKVTVEDGYVVTQIDQIFSNPHNMDLEALYTFPVPETASVAEFSLWIDGKKVSGEVLQKKEAKQIYEEEKSAGRETGLTEKNEFNSFEIRIHPVRAQNNTRMRLVYIQPAVVDTGMGRYLYPLESGGVDDHQESFWTANEKVEENFSFEFKLRSSIPVDGIRVPGFSQASVIEKNPQEWEVGINSIQQVEEGGNTAANQGGFSLNKDVVVYWRQADNIPARVDMVTSKLGRDEQGTFMITITPGDDLKRIQEGRDWVFVLDRSGSMQGKFKTLLQGVEKALGKMSDRDRFRIIMFGERAGELTQGYITATVPNVQAVLKKLFNETPGGGTNLHAGLKRALNAVDADRTTSLVLVTDGVANVGTTKQSAFVKLLKTKDIRLFTFMMGNSANEFLLKHLTDVSNGFALSVSNSDDMVGRILSANSKVTHQALHGIKVSISGVSTTDMTLNNSSSLYRGDQLIILGHYSRGGSAELTLNGKISGQQKNYDTSFEFPEVSLQHPEIERLWAYAKIEEIKRSMVFQDDDTESEQAIIDLSKQYGIVTDYTSMLVVRDEIFEKRGIKRTNRKRLENESQAREKREQSPVQSTRVDGKKPMYTSNQATHRKSSGGGALDLWFLLTLLPLVAYKTVNKKEL